MCFSEQPKGVGSAATAQTVADDLLGLELLRALVAAVG